MDRRIPVIAAVFVLSASAPALAQNPRVLGSVDGFAASEQLGSQNALAGLGDVTGDGVPDFIAGAPGWPMPHPTIPGATIAQVGKARVFSGATLAQLFEITGTYNLQAMGKSVANVGDVDGDGLADVAAGAPMFGPTVPGAVPPPPQVQVWSTGTFALLYTITSGSGGFSSANFGVSIAGVGDVGQLAGGVYVATPDGVPDILVGASAGNAAAVYSGVDGALLYSISAATLNPPPPATPLLNPNEDFGGTVASAGDVTGDGIQDLLVCARLSALGGVLSNASGTFYAGAVFLLSGAGGGFINVFLGGPGDGLGNGAAGLGDVDGDLVPDIAVGATRTDAGGTDAGSVTVYSGATWLSLWTTHGLAAGDFFGYAVSSAGDVTGDGRPDVLVGTPTTDVGATNTGSAALLDGVTGTRLLARHGLLASDLLGRSIAPLGDVDLDGTQDVLAGAPFADVGGSSTGTVSIISFGPYLRPCAAGAIAAPGGTFDMIRVNGAGGGPARRVDLASLQPFTIEFVQPPPFAFPAPLYAFGVLGVPALSDELSVPPLGTLCFPPPILTLPNPQLFLLSNSFFPPDPTALIPISPLGAWTIPVPSGLPGPLRVTLSGVTADAALIRTNSLLIDIQ